MKIASNSAAHATDSTPHLEIEMKVALCNKEEEKKVKSRLKKKFGFKRERSSLIVDFVEPGSSETKRIRLETSLAPLPGTPVSCVLGKKSHPIEGELSPFVRSEKEETVSAEDALRRLMSALLSNDGEPIPYYTKRRHYYRGIVGDYDVALSLDKPNGLLRKYSKRFLEAEIQLPETSDETAAAAATEALRRFIEELLGRKASPEPSYRRMLRETWDARRL